MNNVAELVPPTPSPSLNGALLCFCRVTYSKDLDAAAYLETATKIVRSYEPETTAGRRISVEDFLSWFDDLSADEYFALAGADKGELDPVSQKGAAWE